MSLYFTRARTSARVPVGRLGNAHVTTLHRFECKVCPLNTAKCLSPKMAPSGDSRPLVYFLGEAPGKTEDQKGEPFVGPAGEHLRAHIPRSFEDSVRFNNCVRTWPGQGNPTPGKVEVECCRPSVTRDIEATKPRVIVGLGNVPLYWATREEGVTKWRGRRFPVRVGEHTCWFYPTFHPSYVIRERGKRERENRRGKSEAERLFEDDMRRVFDEIDDLPEPFVETDPYSCIETVTGTGGARDVRRVREFLRDLVKRSKEDENHRCALDYETNSLRPYALVRTRGKQSYVVHDAPPGWRPRVLTVAVGTYKSTMAFALDHADAKWSRAQRDEVMQAYGEFLREYRGRIACHNAAFEQEWTVHLFGAEAVWRQRWDDTMAIAYTLDERVGMMSLDVLCFLYLGVFLKELSPIDVTKLSETPVEEVLKYNGLDTRHTDHLRDFMLAELARDKPLKRVYREQMRRTPAFVLTQARGVYTSPAAVRDVLFELEERVGNLEYEISLNPDVRAYGVDRIRATEPDSVGRFFAHLGYDEVLTDDDRYGTDKSVLNTIDHPVAASVLEIRGATKMLSTYAKVFEPGKGRCVYPDHRVHTSYNVNRTRTGRTSSNDPNMQNMPKRDEGYRSLRRMFVARKGHVLIAADYGQIEARVIAMASRDPRFVKALWEDYDVHMEWAERIAAAYPSRVVDGNMKALRGDVKNQFVFPLFFGAGRNKVSAALGVPRDVIDPLIDDFWDDFSGVKDWQETVLKFYETHGYVECLTYGRRRRAPIDYNQIINTPIQGTASDIVVDAQCDLVADAMDSGREWLVPVLNVHDDLTSDVPVEHVDEALETIVGTMLGREYDFLNVPLQVEVEVGRDWYSMKEIGKFRSDQW